MELVEMFLEFENKYEMFNIKINGVHIWHYIRFDIYNDILHELSGVEVLLSSTSPINKADVSYEYFIRKNILCNQFFASKRDILLISHPRKYSDGNGYYKCIYTDELDKNLKQSHYILADKSVEGVYAKQRSKNVIYADLEAFNKIMGVKIQQEVIKTSEISKKIIKPIENYFNIKIDVETKKRWHNIVVFYITGRKYYYKYYNFLLQKIKPKLIIMVVSYAFDRMVLCEVAHKKRIPVVELQHGQIHKEHIAYNFPKRMKLNSFPDYIFTFGKLFIEGIKYPIAPKNIISVGYPELEKNYKLYRNKVKKNRKTILFISQCNFEIIKYVNILAETLDNKKYRIVFQLHPKEYFSWKNTVGKYINNKFVEVIGSYNHTVHESLGEADWVVGSYSTVLFEALMFDVKVAIMKIGQYNAAESLYINGYAILVDSPEQLIDEIQKDTFEVNKDVNIFEMNSLTKMQAAIDKILGE
jgi:CDP-glycerol glycerophosphotransferase (TagB/SpsB family)